MNTGKNENYESSNSFEYQVDKSRGRDSEESRSKRPQYARGAGRPGAFNGIHRRRNKRWSW